MRRTGFTLLEVVLAITLATMAVGVLVTVFGATTVGARIAQQAEASSQVRALIEEELEQGNAVLTAGGAWDYGELPAVVPVSRQDLNRYRLEIEQLGVESYAGGGDVVRYGILLCSMPVGADAESCTQTEFRAPPPAVAASAGVTIDAATQLYVGGEDPTGSAHVVASNGTATQTYTSYGTYDLAAGYTVTAENVVNASGIRYVPEVASGGGAVQVYYRADSGALVVNVTKEEPNLVIPTIDLSGPGGFAATVPEGESRFPEAQAGTYQLVAPTASYGGYDYEARYGTTAAADGSFQIRTGEVKRVEARYTATNGKLRLEFKGGGPAPQISLAKQTGSDDTLIDTFTLSATRSFVRMEPATYAVTLAGNYLSGGVRYGLEFRRYDPAREAWSPWFKEDEVRFALVPGRETIVWMRAYPVTGVLTLRIGGPADTSFSVTLAGTRLDGALFKQTFDRPGIYVVEDLAPGTYSIQASSGQDGSGNYYVFEGPEEVSLAAGESKEITLDYTLVREGTLVVFNVSTATGPRWENEPTAYKTAVVDGGTATVPASAWTTHRSFQPLLIPPGKDGWICTTTPIEGQYVTYEVTDFLKRPQNEWVDCLTFRGETGNLRVERATASVRPISGFFSTQVNLVTTSPPDADFYARFRIERNNSSGFVVWNPAEVKGTELVEDPNAPARWKGSKTEQVQDVANITAAYGIGRYEGNLCDLWNLDVTVYSPDGTSTNSSGSFSREEVVTLAISNLTFIGQKAYFDLYASCP